MTAQPQVSVVVIFFNEERFLADAVDSVLAQTYRDWELLLVDDGSTDGSSAIARRYARAHQDRVRYLEHRGHQNLGMSATRNLGLQAVRGSLVAFLDADDIWRPDKLERQSALLAAHPSAAFVTGRKEYWYSWTGNSEDAQRDYVQPMDVPHDALVEPPALLIAFLKNQYSSPSDLLLRRSAIEAVGGYESGFRGMFEDQVFLTKLCLRFPVLTASASWYRYRQHPESCVAVAASEGANGAARRRFLEWVTDYVAGQQSASRELQGTLRAEMRPFTHPRLTRARRRFWQFRQDVLAGLGMKPSHPERR